MPNWVTNEMVFEGDEQSISALRSMLVADNEFRRFRSTAFPGSYDDNDKETFSFSNLVGPTLPEFEAYFSDGGGSVENNWYEWNILYWGTKWDACEPEINIVSHGDSTLLELSFQTAWSPINDALIVRFAVLLNALGIKSATYAYEEEQGWGSFLNYDAEQGNFVIVNEYDVDGVVRSVDAVVDGSNIQTQYETNKTILDQLRSLQSKKESNVEVRMVP